MAESLAIDLFVLLKCFTLILTIPGLVDPSAKLKILSDKTMGPLALSLRMESSGSEPDLHLH